MNFLAKFHERFLQAKLDMLEKITAKPLPAGFHYVIDWKGEPKPDGSLEFTWTAVPTPGDGPTVLLVP